jgi:hypothetical protein
MSSSNSSKMEDQITMAFSGVMDEAMNILQVEETTVATSSSSTRWLKRRRSYINHDCEASHFRLWHDYFDDDYLYPPSYFHRRYHMRMTLFLSIMYKLSETSSYFSERNDAIDCVAFTVLQKCIAVVRELAYGMAADMIDEYPKLGKSTVLECLEYYCVDIIEYFGTEFLHHPIVADTQHLLAKAEEHGFPGILGIIDCMHW